MAWTAEQNERLILGRAAGLSHREIAERIGKTRKAVSHRWARISDPPCEPREFWSPEEKEFITQKWLAGWTSPQIAAEFRVSKSSVVGLIRRLELPKRGPALAWTDEEKNIAKTKWLDGWSAGAIARQTGRSRNAVIGLVHRLGWIRPRGHSVLAIGRTKPKQPRVRLPSTGGIPRTPAPVISISADHKFLSVPLPDLGPDQCRYPLGDGPFLFCGQPVIPKESYCPHCWRITHAPRPNHPTRYTFEDAA